MVLLPLHTTDVISVYVPVRLHLPESKAVWFSTVTLLLGRGPPGPITLRK